MRSIAILGGALGILGQIPIPSAANDAVVSALRDELARSVEKLEIEKLGRPYFISYAVDDMRTAEAAASFGALAESGANRFRNLTVEVRVGDRRIDSSGYLSPRWESSGILPMYGGVVQLPIDDDYRELRRQIWLATDGAYKKALEDLAGKNAYLQNRTRVDDAPDFSEQTPVVLSDSSPALAFKLAEMESLARDVSRLFRAMPEIHSSTVRVSASDVLRHYVNSEGSVYSRRRPGVAFTVTAYTQAPDGTPIEDFLSSYATTFAKLPGREALAARVRDLGARLTQRRAAPAVETYNGPVLLEGQAAVEAFAQVFVPNLLAVRSPAADDARFRAYFASQFESPFLDRIGARVLPESLSLADNPRLEEWEGKPLVASVTVDDEGVATRETRLVENGYLRGLLATRSPVRDIRRSTGSRQGSGPLPTNLIITPSIGLTAEETRAELLRRARLRGHEYGIVVRRLGNPFLRAQESQGSGRAPETLERALLVFKVFPNGREELVREAELSGVSTGEFKAILAVTKEVTVESVPLRVKGTGGWTPSVIVSLAVPGLLFEEVSVKRPTDVIPRVPIARHPFFDHPAR